MRAPDRVLAAVRDGQRRAGVERLPTVLRPLVLSADELAAVRAAAQTVHRELAMVLRLWALEGLCQAAVPVPEALRPLALRQAAGPSPLGFTRYDLFLDRRTLQVSLLECQAGDPSGMGLQHGMLEALRGSGCWEASDGHACRSLAEALCDWLGPQLPGGLTAFVAPESSFVHNDHLTVAGVFARRGFDAEVVDPRAFSLRGEALEASGRRVGAVVRDTTDELLLEPFRDGAQPLLEAWTRGLVPVWNPASAIAGDAKTLLEPLRARPGMAPLMPRTLTLEPALRQAALEAQRGWVLKPSDGYGGFGIVIGPEVDAPTWQRAIDAALAGASRFVLQAYVAPPVEAFPVVEDGAVVVRDRNVVLSAWMVGDRFAGLFARIGPTAVINVHQGGGLIPVLSPGSPPE